MILTVGNSGSYELSAFALVKEMLEASGEKVVLFRQDRCLENDHLMFGTTKGGVFATVTIDGNTWQLEEFSSIWYLHPHLPKELLNFEPREYRHFIHRQFEEARRALWSIFREKRWVNDPWATIAADNKAHQLHVASRVGFIVPDTLITSSPEHVREFYQRHEGNIVVKSFATSPIPDKVIYTNRVSAQDLEHIDSVKSSPSIFQKRLEKEYELRITVVGSNVFPVRIESQNDEATALDWRKKPKLNDFEVILKPTTIPKDVEGKIAKLMDTLGIRFGCIDMVVTPNGDHVFLEVNPSGQWYFVQLKTHLPIAEAIADLLTT